MKLLPLIVSIFLFSVNAKAQLENQFRNKLWEEYKNKKLDTDKYKLQYKTDKSFKLMPKIEELADPKQPDEVAVVKLPSAGRHLGSNGMGSEIYAMEPDNMPCLVPGSNFESNMPVAADRNGKRLKPPFNNSPDGLQEKLEKRKQFENGERNK